jgi:hypothetical protein
MKHSTPNEVCRGTLEAWHEPWTKGKIDINSKDRRASDLNKPRKFSVIRQRKTEAGKSTYVDHRQCFRHASCIYLIRIPFYQ